MDILQFLRGEGAFFEPHGFCLLWNPVLLWLHVASDALITFAYVAIPASIFVLMRKRRDLPFNRMFALFGIFIVLCGATHAMGVWTMWKPAYWLEGVVKAATALASVPTAILLIKLMPRIVSFAGYASSVRPARGFDVEFPSSTERAAPEAEGMLIARLVETEEALRVAQSQLKDCQKDKAALEKRLLKASSIVEGSWSAVVTVNAQGIVDGWNDGAERIYGYREDEMVGQSMETVYRRLIPPEHTEEFHRVIQAARLGRAVPRVATVRLRKDGRRVAVTNNVLPIIDAGGDVVGLSFVCDDIEPKAESQ
jgi:PAS domain S-box-containing protein